MEAIRINIELLEVYRMTGKIRITDKAYFEIIQLDRKHRRTFEDFVVDRLPATTGEAGIHAPADTGSEFTAWAEDLSVSLNYLDRITKDYIQRLIDGDEAAGQLFREPDIRDKRFWDFLESLRNKAPVFDSFRLTDAEGGSDQATDPEKDKRDQE